MEQIQPVQQATWGSATWRAETIGSVTAASYGHFNFRIRQHG